LRCDHPQKSLYGRRGGVREVNGCLGTQDDDTGAGALLTVVASAKLESPEKPRSVRSRNKCLVHVGHQRSSVCLDAERLVSDPRTITIYSGMRCSTTHPLIALAESVLPKLTFPLIPFPSLPPLNLGTHPLIFVSDSSQLILQSDSQLPGPPYGYRYQWTTRVAQARLNELRNEIAGRFEM